jgi:mannose-6-phosphate isomerase
MLPDLLRLEPLLVERPWGGRRLARLGKAVPAGALIGESWEVADLAPTADEDARCTRVTGGPADGSTLADLIERHGAELLGSAGPTYDGRFPLLVKFLDAAEHLSVQVHPPEAIADVDAAVRAKTESWYVMDADPGSAMWFDIRTDVDDAAFAGAAGTSSVVPMLGVVPARVGDFHHIPAGRVHALGAGVMVLEIQTPSDTTFRLYDWSDEYSRTPRSLHVREALRSVVRGDPTAISVAGSSAAGARELVRTPAYWIREHRAGEVPIALDPRPELRVVAVVAGEVSIDGERLGVGAVRVLPAGSRAFGVIDHADDAVVIESGVA